MSEGENKFGESGIEELRQLAGISRDTRESAFDGLTLLECVNLLRAVRACDWDIYADALTEEERLDAAKTGQLSAECVARLDLEFGDDGSREVDDDTCGACGASLVPIAGSLWHKVEEDCRATREPSAEEIIAHEVKECVDRGDHLVSCDDDGYCNACGHQEGGV